MMIFKTYLPNKGKMKEKHFKEENEDKIVSVLLFSNHSSVQLSYISNEQLIMMGGI